MNKRTFPYADVAILIFGTTVMGTHDFGWLSGAAIAILSGFRLIRQYIRSAGEE